MSSTAFLFPGQGSQRVGMGRDLVERYPDLAGPIFRTADEILGFELSRICWDGPADALRRTDITQPAVFVASVAAYRVLAANAPRPRIVAGHSLGEYTALVAAGALDWTEALTLVRRRGELMARVNETTPGAMAAVVGLPAALVEALCSEAASSDPAHVVEVANYNDDAQTVVSGTEAGVDAVTRAVRAKEDPDVKVVRLEVGAPFHCSLMRPVEADFGADLDAARFSDPEIPVVANVSAQPVHTGEQARAALRAQLAGSVRWRHSMHTVVEHGVDTFVEVGPGRVLTGFSRRSYPDLATHSASDARRVEKVVSALGLALSA